MLRARLETLTRANQRRAEAQEKLATLVKLRQPDQAAPTLQDWVNVARTIGAHPARLLAVKAVESGGAAFNAEGRLVIAYEPHVFSRNSTPKHGYDASHPQLSYRRWIDVRSLPPSAWHPMRLKQADRWDLLVQAASLDFYAGTAAASYGMWQILGENARKLGYRDPMHMIEVMYQGHEGQWEAFVRFCRWAGCLDALIKGDWATFEKRYNGGGHKGAYARKLTIAEAEARKTLA